MADTYPEEKSNETFATALQDYLPGVRREARGGLETKWGFE